MNWSSDAPDNETEAPEVKVWDLLVRIFHWLLVTLFAVAYLSGDELEQVHELAGYGVAGLIAFRVVWGLIGSRHARFSDFIYRPATVIGFLRDSVFMRARRYLGHNPAGGTMVVLLLLAITIVCATGILMTSEVYAEADWVEDTHEFAANATLGLIALHVLGVILASIEHGENLVRSMITGRKRPL